jgi:5-methylcytosine-specific restriction endonuclease McrA
MTLDDFNAQRPDLACQQCGSIGLEVCRNINNNGVRPHCPHCGSGQPLKGVTWLSQNNAQARRPKRPSSDPTPADVWEVNGNHCAYCGKTKEECEKYGIGITMQHVHPFADGGEESPLIPFCARCQQGSVAALAETQRIRKRVVTLEDQINGLREKQRELDEKRKGVDHVR